jgi:hypothetical protein
MLMLSIFFVPSGVQQDLDRSLSLLKLEEVNMYVCMYIAKQQQTKTNVPPAPAAGLADQIETKQ